MADKTTQPLFNEFPPVSTEEWMERVTADLKGADFERKLVWQTNEGIKVQPFYREEDLKNLEYLNTLPGEFPYVRGTKTDNKWLVRQEVVVTNAAEANKKVLDLITKGVDSFGFIIEDEKLITQENISLLLSGLSSKEVELNFTTAHGNKKLLQLVSKALKAQNSDLNQVKGSINFDPLGQLTITGESCVTIEELMKDAAELVKEGQTLPAVQTISANAKHFNNAGANIVQELGFGLAMGNEYLAQLTASGLSVDQAAKSLRFNFAIGGNYFMEIAKLRAARLLWAKIVENWKPANQEVSKMHIHCETSEWNKTIYDPYVNMLRTQTEAMSATLGGTNSLTVLPFNKVFAQPTEFSERIARNQQLLLKEESYFNKITDPGAGSYYIENLTDSIAREAWTLFLAVEEKGGFTQALQAGFVQAQVNEASDKLRKDLARRKKTLLGTNQYPNTLEAVAQNINEKQTFADKKEGSSIEPIQLFRGAEQFEKLRLATEKAAKRPKVFMLTYGHLAMRLARSQFSANFFGCAGYEIINNLGFKTVEAGVEAAQKAGADIVVLCSSDDEYAQAAPIALKALNGEAILVIAGAPASADDLKAQGIEHFINVRSNLLETLQEFNNLLKI